MNSGTRIRCIWHGEPPEFPPVDQHPDARRFGPITLSDGRIVYVDALGPKPDVAEIEAAMPLPRLRPAVLAAAKLDQHLQSAITEFSEPTASTAPETDNPGKPAMAVQQSPASAAMTIKEVLEEHGKKLGKILDAQLALLQAELDGQVVTVMKGTDAVITKVRGHTDDFRAILGQFVNDV